MFQIGDKVVHPMYGAGVVESIVQKTVDSVVRDYYILQLPNRSMVVMVPTDNCEEIGVRRVVDQTQADQVMAAIPDIQVEMTANWNHRYRENMERMKSGDLFEVARVIKSLLRRDSERGLSTGERKMLRTAKQILISEMVLSMGQDYQAIEHLITTAMTGGVAL